MKIPLKPPDFNKLIEEIRNNKDINKFIGSGKEYIPDKYYHWDQLRHRTPPEQLSHEEWWFMTKLQRSLLYEQLNFFDKEGKPFKYALTDKILKILLEVDRLMPRVLKLLGEIEDLEPGFIQESKYQFRYQRRYPKQEKIKQVAIMQEAITSSQMEGASTTRVVAKKLIRYGKKPSDISEKMILNNYLTMKLLIEDLKDKKISEELIFEIHKRITQETLDDNTSPGRYRTREENIEVRDPRDNKLLYVPPTANELPDRMKKLIDFANDDGVIHPVIKAIIIHFWLAYEHPFNDGNGRTARILFYWSMLKDRYWIFELISISEIILRGKAKYLKAFLYTETDDNDLTYFILYHLDIIKAAIDSFCNDIEKRKKEIRKIESYISNPSLLNHRQKALISHAINHPSYEYSVESHRVSHDITQETARTDLNKLEQFGLFTSKKIKNSLIYRSVKNIKNKLSKL